jgi:hypothetical protein
MRKELRKVVAGKVIEGERFVRITFHREETVIRQGTADLAITPGTEIDLRDGSSDRESLALSLVAFNAIDWADEVYVKERNTVNEVWQEIPLEAASETAFRCSRGEDDDLRIALWGDCKKSS